MPGGYIGKSSKPRGFMLFGQGLEDPEGDWDMKHYEEWEGDWELAEVLTGGRFKVVSSRPTDDGYVVTIKQIATFDPDSGLATKKANRRWAWDGLFNGSYIGTARQFATLEDRAAKPRTDETPLP